MGTKEAPRTIILEKNIGGVRQKHQPSEIKPGQTPSSTKVSKKDEPRGFWYGCALVLFTLLLIFPLVATFILIGGLIGNSQFVQIQILKRNSIDAPIIIPPTTPGRVNTNDGSVDNGAVATVKIYRYRARSGQGVYHLSRRAVHDHLKRSNLKLSAARELFFITKLSSLSNPRPMEIGEERIFGQDRLDRLLDAAQNLPSRELARWEKLLH